MSLETSLGTCRWKRDLGIFCTSFVCKLVFISEMVWVNSSLPSPRAGHRCEYTEGIKDQREGHGEKHLRNKPKHISLVKVSNSCKFQWNLLRRDVFAAPNLRKRHQNELHPHVRHQRAAVSMLCLAGLSGTDVMEGKACPTQDETGD